MRRKLYGNKITPACGTCAHARRSADGKGMLCPYRGAVSLEDECRRYEYDPLKRIPRRPPAPAPHSAEEFTLDE